MIAWDSLQPPQKVFLQGHLEKGWRSAKCQGGVAALDANNWPQHIPREKVEKKEKCDAMSKEGIGPASSPLLLNTGNISQTSPL
ncbi:hypothetical protein H8957_010339, partial [Semnopithecus entellus]